MGDKPSKWVEKLPRVRNFNYFGGENQVFDILRSSFDLLQQIEQSLFMDLIFLNPNPTMWFSSRVNEGDMKEWLCLVYKVDEEEIKSRVFPSLPALRFLSV